MSSIHELPLGGPRPRAFGKNSCPPPDQNSWIRPWLELFLTPDRKPFSFDERTPPPSLCAPMVIWIFPRIIKAFVSICRIQGVTGTKVRFSDSFSNCYLSCHVATISVYLKSMDFEYDLFFPWGKLFSICAHSGPSACIAWWSRKWIFG